MKHNVLVFPCGSEIGLEVHRSLSFSTHFEIFGASSTDDHGEFVYKNYIGGIPFVDEPGFVEQLNQVIEENQIKFIIPAHDSVLLKLAREKALGNINCEVITSPQETCEIAGSKLKTYENFAGIIPTPKVYKNISELDESNLPIFLKPEVGQGSKGTHIAKSLEDIEFYTKKDPSLLLLEYLPGKEYTIDCFTDKNRKLRFCEGRERKRISGGISVNSACVADNRFIQMAGAINSRIVLRGAWFFQVKENAGGELILMEIAPRVAGTMGLIRNKGVNLPLLSLFDATGVDIDVFENHYDMVIDRALQNLYQHDINYEHVYLDFDDLVVFEGKVNPNVIAFIYQCFNKNVKVHLLTKHKENLDVTLKKYRLSSNIFDEIIWIKNEDEKHLSINEKKAIFIDDSFAERKKVYEVSGIPVFDSHMIEGLMEKF